MSISSDVSLPLYLGICPLPLETILRSSSSEAAAILAEISAGPRKWRPSAFLPWHFAQLLTKTRFAVNVVSDGRVWLKAAVKAKTKEHTAIVSLDVFTSNLVDIYWDKEFDAFKALRVKPAQTHPYFGILLTSDERPDVKVDGANDNKNVLLAKGQDILAKALGRIESH
jgi:hypothetical protein